MARKISVASSAALGRALAQAATAAVQVMRLGRTPAACILLKTPFTPGTSPARECAPARAVKATTSGARPASSMRSSHSAALPAQELRAKP
eukprot:CAMPEP_0180798604 /NCGR_PEP_ID=MMETSP1038_2-20121128/58054_1 /TAXON_ID=632150 /ORGANISM="Azadinium spinosum, Strain 3D9" /LENGTH=90 /DNA_ID=CAMNT_0022838067 /DNA_START=10 /DNA_END=278 /DNA_ORIENTATION=+